MARRFEISEYDRHIVKINAAKASPFVVSIVAHNVPVDMCPTFRNYLKMAGPPPKEVIFVSSGIILDCQPSSDSNSEYICTILAPASLFNRTGDLPLDHIQLDVHLSSSTVYQAKLMCCDSHYNLAILKIISEFPLQTTHLKRIDDVITIDPTTMTVHPTLRPHSTDSRPFKLTPATPIVSVSRSYLKPRVPIQGWGTLCPSSPEEFSCNELYKIKDKVFLSLDGAPALSTTGYTIGVIFGSSSMLPSNIVSKWWNHYKTFGKFCRPFLGLKVVNLHELDLNSLAHFRNRFPDISATVVVTKVDEDSLAGRSGIRVNDAIVSLETKQVKSKMEFYEALWDNVGETVSVEVVRASDGEKLSVLLMIEETSPDKLHQWPHPSWNRVW